MSRGVYTLSALALLVTACAAPIAGEGGAGTAGWKGEGDDQGEPASDLPEYARTGESCGERMCDFEQDLECLQRTCVPRLDSCRMELSYVKYDAGRTVGRVVVDPSMTSAGYTPQLSFETQDLKDEEPRISYTSATLTRTDGTAKGFDAYELSVDWDAVIAGVGEEDYYVRALLFFTDSAGARWFAGLSSIGENPASWERYVTDMATCFSPGSHTLTLTVERADNGINNWVSPQLGIEGLDGETVVYPDADHLGLYVGPLFRDPVAPTVRIARHMCRRRRAGDRSERRRLSLRLAPWGAGGWGSGDPLWSRVTPPSAQVPGGEKRENPHGCPDTRVARAMQRHPAWEMGKATHRARPSPSFRGRRPVRGPLPSWLRCADRV